EYYDSFNVFKDSKEKERYRYQKCGNNWAKNKTRLQEHYKSCVLVDSIKGTSSSRAKYQAMARSILEKYKEIILYFRLYQTILAVFHYLQIEKYGKQIELVSIIETHWEEIIWLAGLENENKVLLEFAEFVGEKLLNNTANKLQTKTIKTLQSAKTITLTFDGWKNIAKQNIFGITCITKEGEVIIYNARDISNEHSSIEATIKLVKNLLIEDELKDAKIIAVVTDSSSGYAAIYRKLRKELSIIIWLSCFAY
ncbi:28736_t:CDS:2, partial [Dentiscutata erythropus]